MCYTNHKQYTFHKDNDKLVHEQITFIILIYRNNKSKTSCATNSSCATSYNINYDCSRA